MLDIITHKAFAGFTWSFCFAAIIGLAAYRLTEFELIGPDPNGIPFRYPWRLVTPDSRARVISWAGYVTHNLCIWAILWSAQAQKPGYSTNFRWFNWAMIAMHSFFVSAHILHTHLYYDSLAAEIPEIIVLASAAMMLMVVLALEMPRRGLFFGYCKSEP